MMKLPKSLIWNAARDNHLRGMVAAGFSLHKMERVTGLGRDTIKRRIILLGMGDTLEQPGQPWRQEDVAWMLDLYDGGKDAAEIAKIIRRSPASVRGRLLVQLARRRAGREIQHDTPTHEPPNIVQAARNLLKSRGATERSLDQMGMDAVMLAANRIRKAQGRPQLGRKPEWKV